MLPRAQGEFPALEIAELRLEEGLLCESRLGPALPLQQGLKTFTTAAAAFVAWGSCSLPGDNFPA